MIKVFKMNLILTLILSIAISVLIGMALIVMRLINEVWSNGNLHLLTQAEFDKEMVHEPRQRQTVS